MLGNAPKVKRAGVMWAGKAPSTPGEATVQGNHVETVKNRQELNVSLQRQRFFCGKLV